MQFGTIGAGTVAQAIAGHLTAAGDEVVLSNSRGPDTLAGVVAALGPRATAGTVAEAAAADLVFLAVGWPQVAEALAGLPDFGGRILVDTTNSGMVPPTLTDLGAPTGSEYVAAQAPGARVVKAFNTLHAPYIAAEPRHAEGRQLLVYAGDDAAARAEFHAVADRIGFAPVDLGSLRDGGRLMQVDGGPFSALHVLRQG